MRNFNLTHSRINKSVYSDEWLPCRGDFLYVRLVIGFPLFRLPIVSGFWGRWFARLEQLRKKDKAGMASGRLQAAKILESLDKFPPDFMSGRDQPREAEQRDSFE